MPTTVINEQYIVKGEPPTARLAILEVQLECNLTNARIPGAGDDSEA